MFVCLVLGHEYSESKEVFICRDLAWMRSMGKGHVFGTLGSTDGSLIVSIFKRFPLKNVILVPCTISSYFHKDT